MRRRTPPRAGWYRWERIASPTVRTCSRAGRQVTCRSPFLRAGAEGRPREPRGRLACHGPRGPSPRASIEPKPLPRARPLHPHPPRNSLPRSETSHLRCLGQHLWQPRRRRFRPVTRQGEMPGGGFRSTHPARRERRASPNARAGPSQLHASPSGFTERGSSLPGGLLPARDKPAQRGVKPLPTSLESC